MSCRPAPDLMTYVTALVPVAWGVAVYAALVKHAAAAKAVGDPRSRGQLMADEFVHRITAPAAAAAGTGAGAQVGTGSRIPTGGGTAGTGSRAATGTRAGTGTNAGTGPGGGDRAAASMPEPGAAPGSVAGSATRAGAPSCGAAGRDETATTEIAEAVPRCSQFERRPPRRFLIPS